NGAKNNGGRPTDSGNYRKRDWSCRGLRKRRMRIQAIIPGMPEASGDGARATAGAGRIGHTGATKPPAGRHQPKQLDASGGGCTRQRWTAANKRGLRASLPPARDKPRHYLMNIACQSFQRFVFLVRVLCSARRRQKTVGSHRSQPCSPACSLVLRILFGPWKMVAEDRIELPTQRFSVACS